MKNVKVVLGERTHKRYQLARHETLIGKAIEAVAAGNVEGAYGNEPATILYFTDGTFFYFVHPMDLD
jgi:hypothetical protein